MTGAPINDALALAGAVPAVPLRTVFFASDPAGQRACLALAALLRARAPEATPRIYCNRACDFAADDSVPIVRLDRMPSAEDMAGAELVFCGTSHPNSSSSFELGAISVAGHAGIRSTAFVDHWTNFRLRFQAKDGRLILPDEIWVLDAHAAALAEADDLPPERLRISGSPTLAFLSRLWRSPRTADAIRAAALPAKTTGPIVLYAPDPVSLRDVTRAQGFDELSAARDLAEAAAFAADATVIIRLHPLEPAAQRPAIEEAFASRGVRTRLPDSTLASWELCSIADVVVGFYSNFLLEAWALGRPVIRYFPGPAQFDPLHHLAFGRKVIGSRALVAALTSLGPAAGAGT